MYLREFFCYSGFLQALADEWKNRDVIREADVHKKIEEYNKLEIKLEVNVYIYIYLYIYIYIYIYVCMYNIYI